MPTASASRSAVRRRFAAASGLVLATVLALGGCTGGDKASEGSTTTHTASAPVSASPFPTREATPSPTPDPTTASPKPEPSSHEPSDEPSAEESHARPAPEHTRADASTGSSGRSSGTESACEIRSNAGNCYQAGQFCRKSDVGASTHDAHGRLITCGSDSGRPRWHY